MRRQHPGLGEFLRAETAARLRTLPLCSMLMVGAWGCGGSGPSDANADPQVIDSRPTAGWSCSIAADGSAVVVTYPGPRETGGIYLARSSDGGATFDKTKIVLVDAAGFTTGAVTIAGRTIFVAYGGKDVDARLARSDDGGETFTIRPVSTDALAPAMLVSGETVYLAYRPLSSAGVYFQRSGDGGVTWSGPVPISVGNAIERTLSLGTVAGVLYVSFYDDDTSQMTAHSSDSGATWIVEPGQDLLSTGSLVATAEGVFLPMVDQADNLFVTESNNSGATWTRHPFDVVGGAFGDNPLDDFNDLTIAGVRLATAGTTMYAIFNQGSLFASSKLGFARSTNHGVTWPAEDVVTAFAQKGGGGGSYLTEVAAMAVSTDPVPAILIAFVDGDHVKVLRSTDDGATWP